MPEGMALSDVAHIVVAIGTVVSSCFSIYLAHKRKQADRERRDFYRMMSRRVRGEEWSQEPWSTDERKRRGL